MPIYDPLEQRMAVRVVYDGVACAGKTTNLRQLCMLLAAQKSSEIYSPSDLHGRTLFFDWMHVMAGVVCGFPLLCQVVSVPGQVVLTPRRRHLLASADVVVYVCESNEANIASARAGLALYDEVARERGITIPLVLQANKQDQPGALSGVELARALGREGTLVIEGIASDGVGVVDTFVNAVRTVARAIEARSERDSIRVHVRRAETAAEVLAHLVEQQVDPEWAAEMLLEEAQAAFMLEAAYHEVSENAELKAAAAAAAEDLARIAAPEIAPTPELAPATDRPRRVVTVAAPSPDVPTGFIWPAHTGRATVRALGLSVGLEGVFDDQGVLAHVVLGHVARTSTRARHADGESARQALVRTARECTQLDRLLVPDTVLVAQPASDGSCWIWTVRTDLPTVDRVLRTGAGTPRLLASYGVAIVEALRMSLRHGLSIDLSAASFGVQNDALRYLGELSPEPPTAASLSASIFASIEAIERSGAEVGAFLEAFERALQRQLTVEERTRAAVSMSDPPPSSEVSRRMAGQRLFAVLARASEAR